MICQVCYNVLSREQQHIKNPRYNSKHHPTILSLITAVKTKKCYICNRFWARLTTEERDLIVSLASGDGAEESCGGVGIDEIGNGNVGYVTVCDLSDATAYGFPGCCLFSITFRDMRNISARATLILQPLKTAKNSTITRRSISASIVSDETWSLAKKWIADCTENHTHCKITPKEEDEEDRWWYPTRLLDVRSSGSSPSNPDIIRLIESEEEVVSGSTYITLSHRWGNSKPLQLRRDTYARFRSGIPLDSMPPTFRDAVLVTRRLDVRYLWIDALCIIQNHDDDEDLSDWSHEASLMHKVYSAAYCNISAAAASSSSSHEGFLFGSRDPELLVSPIIKLTPGDDTTPEDYLVSDFKFWDTEVSLAAINSRGWVLQERILAPRILYFGERQLIWECGEKDAAEIYPDGLPREISTGSDARFKDLCPATYLQQVRRFKGLNINPGVSAHLLWMRVIEAYSHCQLTKPDDKLLALSGIAKRMADILEDQYVAGMWRRYLASELAWFVETTNGGRRLSHEQPGRSVNYRAPSFSWASVDGGITPGLPSDKGILLDIEAVHLDYATDDITGAIKGGYLQLRGRLKKLQLLHRFIEDRTQWICVVNGTEISTLEEFGCAGEMQPFIRLDEPGEDFAESVLAKSIYCLPVRKSTDPNGNLYLLLLEEVLENSNPRGTFRRIGFARSFVHATKEVLLATGEDLSGLPCREYRDGLHSLTIV